MKISTENQEKLKKLKNEYNIKTYDDLITKLIERNDKYISFITEQTSDVIKTEEQKQHQVNENPQSLELILSEQIGETVTNEDLKILFDGQDLEQKTDLTKRQVLALSKAKTFSERYNSKVLNDFITNYSKYSISKDRKGRTEFVESFKVKVLEPLGLGGVLDGVNKNKDN